MLSGGAVLRFSSVYPCWPRWLRPAGRCVGEERRRGCSRHSSSPGWQEPRPRGGEGGATRGRGRVLSGHIPYVTADGPPLASRATLEARGEAMGRGRSRAVLVGRAYPGSAPGLAATLKFSSAESRGKGCGQAGDQRGRGYKRLRPLRHDTRPRPSRRLPGGRQGAGVCAGADLGTVGGDGLFRYPVRAAWRGQDRGRRGQAWPLRGYARGLEPHP